MDSTSLSFKNEEIKGKKNNSVKRRKLKKIFSPNLDLIGPFRAFKSLDSCKEFIDQRDCCCCCCVFISVLTIHLRYIINTYNKDRTT